MNSLRSFFNLEGLQNIMKLCNAALLISIIKNHYCGLWERSTVEEDTQTGYVYGCFFGSFLW